jgi:iron complex transport system substrate-binding protein
VPRDDDLEGKGYAMKSRAIWPGFFVLLVITIACAGCVESTGQQASNQTSGVVTVQDSLGRNVTIPSDPTRIICTGTSCIRYVVYLDAEDKLAAATSADQANSSVTHEDRPYVLANPQFANLPSLGSSDSSINQEQIVALHPQVIFAFVSASNLSTDGLTSADVLQAKTGIPVIAETPGAITTDDGWSQIYTTFRHMGHVLHKEQRAEELITYVNASISDLENRTGNISASEQKTAYIGGLGYGGAHGITGTQSVYPPFEWVHVKNVAGNYTHQSSVEFSKESLIYVNPRYIFLDANTLSIQEGISGFEEIKNPVFSDMLAVRNGDVYAVFAYNHGSTNIDTALADAYFIGKTVYPDRFADIDPKEKADEIYTMFVGKPVFDQLNGNCNDLGFEKVPLK